MSVEQKFAELYAAAQEVAAFHRRHGVLMESCALTKSDLIAMHRELAAASMRMAAAMSALALAMDPDGVRRSQIRLVEDESE